jgi:flagellar protein FlgJ
MDIITDKTQFLLQNDAVKKSAASKELKKACQQFESIFINYLLQKMRETVSKNGFFEQGLSFDIVQSMHDQALAEELSKSGNLGLAEQIYSQMSKYV